MLQATVGAALLGLFVLAVLTPAGTVVGAAYRHNGCSGHCRRLDALPERGFDDRLVRAFLVA